MNNNTVPSSDQLKKELERAKGKKNKGGGKGFIKGLIVMFIVVAAVVSILTTRYFPIMRIEGDSMTPNLKNGIITVAMKTEDLKRGDICCFYSGNTILCKRIIAVAGEVVNIDSNGVVYIDNKPLDEPYVEELDPGNGDIVFPYLVPEHTYFVMGDNRKISKDSRYTDIGCVAEGQMIGKLVFCFWPIDEIGLIE